jgi:hypothetical protein
VKSLLTSERANVGMYGEEECSGYGEGAPATEEAQPGTPEGDRGYGRRGQVEGSQSQTAGIRQEEGEMSNQVFLEAPFEMANLFPKHTGLPFVIWISVKGGARHDVRVKISANSKAMPDEMTTVGIRPEVRVIEGEMDAGSFERLKAWIELNRATLISYWEGDIDTQDALDALAKVE